MVEFFENLCHSSDPAMADLGVTLRDIVKYKVCPLVCRPLFILLGGQSKPSSYKWRGFVAILDRQLSIYHD